MLCARGALRRPFGPAPGTSSTAPTTSAARQGRVADRRVDDPARRRGLLLRDRQAALMGAAPRRHDERRHRGYRWQPSRQAKAWSAACGVRRRRSSACGWRSRRQAHLPDPGGCRRREGDWRVADEVALAPSKKRPVPWMVLLFAPRLGGAGTPDLLAICAFRTRLDGAPEPRRPVRPAEHRAGRRARVLRARRVATR